jgi:ribonucleoside-diphosphate reductase alpha chain
MKEAGFPNEPDVMKPNHTTVFSFPVSAPKDSVFRTDLTAVEQLKLWVKYQTHWCEHKPSITVSVKEPEWFDVGAWVWNNFDSISGISFLPFSEHTYRQAPYQDCTKKEYDELLVKIPKKVDWTTLSNYEQQDYTIASQELACSAEGGCEIVDL